MKRSEIKMRAGWHEAAFSQHMGFKQVGFGGIAELGWLAPLASKQAAGRGGTVPS
jgi:hypothetical protein